MITIWKRIPLALAFLGLACGGPSREDTERQQASQMQGMEGMPGMQAGGPDTLGMPGMAGGPGSPIRVTAQQAALAGVTFAVAREAPLERTVRAVAMVVPNERGLAIVNARVSGWVEKLYAKETGRLVRPGQPLLELYAPELVTGQEELLLAKRLAGTPHGDSLLAAARRRLKLWEISDDQIGELERTGEVRRTLTIRSNYNGHVLERNVIEGEQVEAGDPLFRIADLSTIWIEPAIFEQDIALVRVGQSGEVTFDALPGRAFEGRVTFIYPSLDMRTRTLRVRVEVPNPGFAIKPMMYGTVRIRASGPRGVLVPLTAVLPTGERDLAFVVREGGVWPTPVVVAGRGDTELLVTEGIAAGDRVVASATFLFDSESSLAAAIKGIMINMGMGLEMGGMPMEDMPTDTGTAGMRIPKGGQEMPEMKIEGRRRP
ncbi:MAG: efflux RND transporter periplasmic adaptor subunit [Gemmatimonadetes bacterium]|nr:efflux RND transporter periplasmic adaptor subunit [Gemmatimonadota bacterium]